jgi:putative redox protein
MVMFPNGRGIRLCGHVERPEEPVKAWAVYAHCFTCDKNYKAGVYLGRHLAKHGIGLLRFDFPGLGGSEGDFSETTLSGYVRDVEAAAEYLEKEYGAPRVLIGHSMGGAAVLLAAENIDSVELVATFAATAEPARLRDKLAETRDQAREFGVGTLVTAGKKHTLRYDFFEDLERHDIRKAVANSQKKHLFIHDREDDTVAYHNAEKLHEWASSPKSLLTVAGAGHLFMNESVIEQISGAVAARLQ